MLSHDHNSSNRGKPLRSVILGCGAITELFHAPALASLQREGLVEVTHIFDPSPERVQAVRRLLTGAESLSSIDGLTAIRPELVVVASPVRFHAEQSIAALEAGAAVLCEKPMAANVAEARRMIDAAESARLPLAVGLCRRFFEPARAIKRMLECGILGRVKRFEFQEGYDSKWPAQSAAFFQRKAGAGGVLIDLGVHVMDLLAWWFGMPASLEYRDDNYGGVEANCEVKMIYTSGTTGRVRLSRDNSMRRFCRIEGESACVQWNDTDAHQLEFELPARNSSSSIGLQIRGVQTKSVNPVGNLSQAFLAQTMNVIAAREGREAICVTGDEGLRSLQIIDSCYAQRQTWAMPWFTEAENKAVALGF